MTRTRLALFLLLFVSYGYFYQAGGWNQNSRFDLVRAITDQGTLRIDIFRRNTGDEAVWQGHYYSDKAPGVALGAVPIVAAVRPVMKAFGGDPESYGGIALLSWLSTLLTVSLATAFAGVWLFDLALEFGATRGGALFAATAFGLASPTWPLATLFLGHAISGSLLLIAFASAARIGFDPGRDVGRGLFAGLAAGWATVCEFPAGVPAMLITLLAIANVRALGWRRAFRILLALAAGALACALILMAYQYACFGSPFRVAYSHEMGFESMQQGWFGINSPRGIRMRRLLFGWYRGIVPLAPLLALAPLGLIGLACRRDTRARLAAITAGLIALFYLLLNASYVYWDGGWSYGPRHMEPAIPFVALGLAWLWTALPRAGRALLTAGWVWGAALSLLGVSVMAQPPEYYRRPIKQLLWPAFRDGDLALSMQTFADSGTPPEQLRQHTGPKAAWNVGMKAGLDGLPSLLPLAAVWIGGAWWLSVAERRRARTATATRPASSPRSSL
jgi:hypothetical protein